MTRDAWFRKIESISGCITFWINRSMPPIFATMNGASSGFTRKTTRTSSCIVKPSFEITSNGLKVFATSSGVHSTVWLVVGMIDRA